MKALAGRFPAEPEAADTPQGPVTDDHRARVCAAMRQHPMSAPYLGQVLSACLGVPVRVADGVGAWYDIPDEMRTRLGPHAVLGQGAVLGARIWQRHLRLQLHIGPLRLDRYDTFFADGDGVTALRQWLAALVGNTYEYEVFPILHRDDVRTGRLGQSRLGRDAFIGTTLGQEHRSDGRYLLSL
jgi:type VI secretion system protein ImpH